MTRDVDFLDVACLNPPTNPRDEIIAKRRRNDVRINTTFGHPSSPGSNQVASDSNQIGSQQPIDNNGYNKKNILKACLGAFAILLILVFTILVLEKLIESEYNKRGPCSVSCGGGYFTSYRTFGNWRTWQPSEKQESCEANPCPVWSNWTVSECSKACGYGNQIWTRQCFYKGEERSPSFCDGLARENKTCYVQDWSPWSTFTSCSETSEKNGLGLMNRTRSCTKNNEIEHEIASCILKKC